MNVREIMDILETLAPLEYAMSWDNPGLLAGRSDTQVSCIYLALDATETAIGAAQAAGAQMLITHHPMIFSPVKHINDEDFIGRRLLTLIENHISYAAMHTNFDVAVMGTLAADILGLTEREPLQVTVPADCTKKTPALGIGCAGRLAAPMTLKACAEFVKQAFEIPAVKIFGDPDAPVSRAAICPGSGKHMTEWALKRGCDVLITGDIDHHEGIDANSLGMLIIDAGHHGIEHIFVDFMADYLKKRLPGVRIEKEANCPPFTVI